MLVYVLNKDGQPLMPTTRCGKVRRLLKSGKAKVVKRCPFTIQLLYRTDTEITQPITLGVDAGSKTIGVSATTKTKVLYEAEVMLRNDISDLLDARRELRRGRRYRKTRYRKPRFDNRVHSKHKGWLAPSVEQKIQTHLIVVDKVCKILPIYTIVVETASFDLQMLKAVDEGKPLPQGTDYQQGELLHFANLREYCFWRDNYTCQWCKGKTKNKILHMHHWNYWRSDHTDKPSSVITLCDTCNDSKNHKQDGFLWGWEPKVTKFYKDATFMGIMRWTFYNKLKEIHNDKHVYMTYGYITKHNRIEANLPKEHYIDARCISGNPQAISDGTVYYQKKVRCHNRQIHKCTINKGGTRKLNQSPYEVNGFKLFDRVKINNIEGFVFGRRRDGRLAIRLLDGTKLNEQISYKKVIKLENAKHYLTERKSHSAAGQAHAVPVAK